MLQIFFGDEDDSDASTVLMEDSDGVSDNEHDVDIRRRHGQLSWRDFVSSCRQLGVPYDYEGYRLKNSEFTVFFQNDVEEAVWMNIGKYHQMETMSGHGTYHLIPFNCCSAESQSFILDDVPYKRGAHDIGGKVLSSLHNEFLLYAGHLNNAMGKDFVSLGALLQHEEFQLMFKVGCVEAGLFRLIGDYLGDKITQFIGLTSVHPVLYTTAETYLTRPIWKTIVLWRVRFDLTTFIARHKKIEAGLLAAASEYNKKYETVKNSVHNSIEYNHHDPLVLTTEESLRQYCTNAVTGELDEEEYAQQRAEHTFKHIKYLRSIEFVGSCMHKVYNAVQMIEFLQTYDYETDVFRANIHSLQCPSSFRMMKQVFFPRFPNFCTLQPTRWRQHYNNTAREMRSNGITSLDDIRAATERTYFGNWNNFVEFRTERCPCNTDTSSLQRKARISSTWAYGPTYQYI